MKLAARGLAQSFDMAWRRVRADRRTAKLTAWNSVGGPRGWRAGCGAEEPPMDGVTLLLLLVALPAWLPPLGLVPATASARLLVRPSDAKARLRGVTPREATRGVERLLEATRLRTARGAIIIGSSCASALRKEMPTSSSLVSGVSAVMSPDAQLSFVPTSSLLSEALSSTTMDGGGGVERVEWPFALVADVEVERHDFAMSAAVLLGWRSRRCWLVLMPVLFAGEPERCDWRKDGAETNDWTSSSKAPLVTPPAPYCCCD